jgi:hypothetical protein
MPIKHAIWTVGEKPVSLPLGRLASEQQLEEMIVADLAILSSEWMLIGRQEITPFGGRIDLLAIAPDASLVLIELKRDKTPREIVAQALDYASWIESLTADKIAQIYLRYSKGGNLNEGFRQRFGAALDEETLNDSHQIILVASELDDSTERILRYLNDREIAINAIFFQVFSHGSTQLISRAWFLDPGDTQTNAVTSTSAARERVPWNGEYYVSFGEGESRSWADAQKYGFISAGGGSWYTQTLKLLSPGDRIWAKIPGQGFVGVGKVLETVQPVREFTVDDGKPALDILSTAEHLRQTADDPEKAEHFVRVEWLDTVPASRAFNEVGLFGNQNTVCRPQTPLWSHTIERMKTVFRRWE